MGSSDYRFPLNTLISGSHLSSGRRHRQKGAATPPPAKGSGGASAETLHILDDLPKRLLITIAELEVIETFLVQLDELLSEANSTASKAKL